MPSRLMPKARHAAPPRTRVAAARLPAVATAPVPVAWEPDDDREQGALPWDDAPTVGAAKPADEEEE